MRNYLVVNDSNGQAETFEQGSDAFLYFEKKIRSGCIYRRRRVPKTQTRSARVEWLCIDEKGI